jgi:hypothetical protein
MANHAVIDAVHGDVVLEKLAAFLDFKELEVGIVQVALHDALLMTFRLIGNRHIALDGSGAGELPLAGHDIGRLGQGRKR